MNTDLRAGPFAHVADPQTVRERVLERAWDLACSEAGPPIAGKRTDAYERSTCACRVPEPVKFTPTSAACTICKASLNVDSEGDPYRRWPGDLTTPEMTNARLAKHARAEMMGVVQRLPATERKRLEALARKHPAQFESEARRIIHASEDMQRDALERHPNTARRARKQLLELADVADAVIAERARRASGADEAAALE